MVPSNDGYGYTEGKIFSVFYIIVRFTGIYYYIHGNRCARFKAFRPILGDDDDNDDDNKGK